MKPDATPFRVRPTVLAALVGLALVAVLLHGSRRSAAALAGSASATPASGITWRADGGPIVPLPDPPQQDPRRVALGRRLFHEVGLSRDGTVACASCHDLTAAGADRGPVSTGVGGARGRHNAPTVYNAALNTLQFWDGRARTLEEQLDGPLTNPLEMASSWDAVVAFLRSDPAYDESFRTLYGGPARPESVRDALVTFERSLITPGAPFDRWLSGETAALSRQARAGHQLFEQIGCVSCHQGLNIGGNLLQRLGTVNEYFGAVSDDGEEDLGRYSVTGRPVDRHRFKVPSLRNVALTAPYLHDGSVAGLDEVVRLMAWHQLGLPLEQPDVELLVAFLRSLSAPGLSAP